MVIMNPIGLAAMAAVNPLIAFAKAVVAFAAINFNEANIPVAEASALAAKAAFASSNVNPFVIRIAIFSASDNPVVDNNAAEFAALKLAVAAVIALISVAPEPRDFMAT